MIVLLAAPEEEASGLREISSRGLPFLAIRAVSDAREESLSPLDLILGEEGTARGRAGWQPT